MFCTRNSRARSMGTCPELPSGPHRVGVGKIVQSLLGGLMLATGDYCSRTSYVPSVNQVLRALKRKEVGLYNCVCSVLSDVAFVKEIHLLYTSLPLVANLRCGLWYAPKHDSTCYFKSTDGHYGNWGFSCTRLNLHVARLAANKGGCVIVDATRRGKSIPDAFTKTVPIWCAVLNRAVREITDQLGLASHSDDRQNCSDSVSETANWDCDIHVPPWVSDNEANHITIRLDDWTKELLQVDADVAGLARCLEKPLRPLWISQNSRIWIDQVPHPEDLPFTPVILVSASLPNARQRRFARQAGDGEGGWTYEYVPGAGDDEESWARGLTPSLLYAHQEELVGSGPDGVHDVVRRVIAEAASSEAAASSSAQAFESAPRAGEGLHNLAPLGARVPVDAAAVCRTGCGLYLIGDTGIALGRPADGLAYRVWDDVSAVLDCSLSPLIRPRIPGSSGQDGGAEGMDGTLVHLPIKDAKHDRHGLQSKLPAALAVISHHLEHGGKVLVVCSGGHDISVCIALTLLLVCFTVDAGEGKRPRFKGAYAPPTPESQADAGKDHHNKHSGHQHGSASVRPGLTASGTESAPELSSKAEERSSACAAERHRGTGTQAEQGGQAEGHPEAASKDEIRRALAYVSACYPHARPSRGSLRQVYNFLLQSEQ